MPIMEPRKLGVLIFVALYLQATRTGAQEQPRTATTNTTAQPTITTTKTTVDTTNNTIVNGSYSVGDVTSLIRARSQEMTVGGLDLSLQESLTDLSEERGKKKKKKKKPPKKKKKKKKPKKKKKIKKPKKPKKKKKKKDKPIFIGLKDLKGFKHPSKNMMIGGSMMTAFVMIFMFMNMITVTLGKALFFTFIAKFLISLNWKSSESSTKKKSSHNDITVVMT